jgi:tetratricopeptide (TPR) repeat protein
MPAKVAKEKTLKDAVQAAQSGDLAGARRLLLKLLRTDNREPLYWLLMSTAVESREERIYCLHNVLFLDPDNSAAKHDLELLGVEVPQANVPALVPEETEDWQTKEIAAPKIPKQIPKRKRRPKEEPWSISWIVASLAIGIVVIILGYYAAESGLLTMVFQTTPSATSSAQEALAATGTQQAEATPTGQITVGPPIPEDLLEATYTPTPVYVNTPHPDNPAFEQGMAALHAEDWASAITAFQNALAVAPQSPDAAYYLGLAQLGAGDLAGAQASFNQAIASGPQFAPGYLGRARVAIARGDALAAVVTDLNTAILLDPRFVEALLLRASFNLARGNFADAETDLAAAEANAPLSALVQYQKALTALAQEKYPAALEASQRAFELDVTLLPNYLAKAQAEQGMGQFANSISTMQLYLTYRGDDAAAWELLGLGFYFDNQRESALEAFDHALSLDPNLPQAAYYRGLQELSEGGLQKALDYFRVAVAGMPAWFEAHIALAEATLATGNPSGAFFEVNSSGRLIETDAHRAMFFYWRARSLEALGQTENALADWRSLLALPPEAVPAEWRQTAEEHVQ